MNVEFTFVKTKFKGRFFDLFCLSFGGVYLLMSSTLPPPPFSLNPVVTFANKVTGQQILLVFKGNWNAKNGIVTIGEPKQGGIPIASVSRFVLLG